jgi:hypothetical protein
MRMDGQSHAPAALPQGKTRHPFGEPQSQSGRLQKISPSPEFDPRTVQPVASRYAHWAIPAHVRAKYRPLILYMMAVSLHCTDMNKFKVIINLKLPPSWVVVGVQN